MPIQADSSRPVKTIDVSGKVISQTQPVGAPVKRTVDAHNRTIETMNAQETPKQDIVATSEEKKEEPKNSEKEVRDLFLKAQKAERKAKEMEKKAKIGLDKADAFDKAVALAENGEDPTAILKAAGLDPLKFYKDFTTYALKEDNKLEDPVQKELREHKEQLDKYKKDNEELAESIKNKEELAEHNKTIQEQVIPIITKDPNKYEVLISEYGKESAVEVYKQVWELYVQKGEVMSFEDAANQLENYWYTQRKSAIIAASKLKKFADLFSQGSQTSRNQLEHNETPSSFTLSNKHNSAPSNKSSSGFLLGETKEERVARIIKKYGG